MFENFAGDPRFDVIVGDVTTDFEFHEIKRACGKKLVAYYWDEPTGKAEYVMVKEKIKNGSKKVDEE